MRVEVGNVIAKSESGSAVADIYTVIYDERIKCETSEASKEILSRARCERYIQPTNCEAEIKIQ
jgi:hypothetical protein